ncbi:GumC family protein [Tellurirhabdus bombi]|uniref:GumC family protein n=1 Tax=Tellurirhabdus bombi TaxID=2907205 RepID=UPI001F1EC683|nr:tyrosine-protein kinase [Tellurirhabdus bombi]
MSSANSKTSDFGNEAVKEYYKFLLIRYYKNWYWFAISLAVCTAVAYLYLRYTQPTYSVQSSVLIKDEQAGSAKENILQELDMFSPKKVVENEMEILKSRALTEKVVDELGFDVSYMVEGRLRDQEIFIDNALRIYVVKANDIAFQKPFEILINKNQVVLEGVSYPYGKVVKTPYGLLQFQKRSANIAHPNITVKINHKDDVVNDLVTSLKISQPRRFSSILVLTQETTLPEKGVAYLNRLVHFYDLASLEDKNKVASNTLRFVDDRLKIIAKELTNVEQNIETYKTSSGIVDLSAESTVFLEKVKDSDTQLNQVAIQLGALQELEKYVQSKPTKGSIVPATIGLEDPTLLGLIKQAVELELQREKIIKTLPETSSAVETIDNQLRITKANISDNATSLKKALLNAQRKFQSSNAKLEAFIRSVPTKERKLLDISRQQSIKGGLYTYLLQKREETALSYASTVSDLRVVDPPKANSTPVRPIRRLVFFITLTLGLLIPTFFIWLTDFFNSKIARKGQIEEITKVPIIGEVVQANVSSPLEVSATSRSVLSEQIRALRTNIQFLNTDNESSQTILVTSSISGEGKSFISLNLAASLAITDRKVILLELDLRKPKLHKYLNISTAKGVSNYLANQATLDEIVLPVEGYPNLYFIPCGPTPPNPSELFSTERMKRLFNDLKESFDFIIADTPPIGLVSDALILAKYSNMTLYIIRHMYTQKAYLKNIATHYSEKRFNNMGLLINGIIPKKDYEYNYGYGGDYGYGYSYTSEYGYSEDKVTKSKKPWYTKITNLW